MTQSKSNNVNRHQNFGGKKEKSTIITPTVLPATSLADGEFRELAAAMIAAALTPTLPMGTGAGHIARRAVNVADALIKVLQEE